MIDVREKQSMMIFRSKVFKILINDKGYDINSLLCRQCSNPKDLIYDLLDAAFLVKDLLKDSSVKRYRRFLYQKSFEEKKFD